MTYLAQETARYAGQPVELFKFRRRAQCWLYTSADQTVTYNTEDYLPVTISRSAFERSDEAGSSSVEVRLARGLSLVNELRAGTPPTPVSATIYRLHRTDPEAIVLFRGEVLNAGMQSEELVVRCVSPLSAEERAVPRYVIMRTCPHVLYGPACALDPDDWDVAGTVVSVTGGGITVNVTEAGTKASGYFNAGVLRVDGTDKRGFIVAHSGTTLTLLDPVPGLAATNAVTLQAGCDHTVETCRDRFSNVPNFGGYPLHPERNPFIRLTLED